MIDIDKLVEAIALHHDDYLGLNVDETINKIKEKLAIVDIIERLCKDMTGYVNPNYGDHSLYIDNCITYKSDEEKELVIKWLDELGVNYKQWGE